MTYTKIATISKTFERCEAEHIGVSKHLLRSLVKSGQLPVVWAGNVALINWDTLQALLNGEIQPQRSEVTGQIKPIPERLPIAR